MTQARPGYLPLWLTKGKPQMYLRATLASLFLALPAFAQDLATGDAIKAAIADKTVQGSMVESGAYTEFYAADGTILGDGYTGTWTVENLSLIHI